MCNTILVHRQLKQMGYKTKSMLYQSSGDNIKLFKKHKARRMRDSDTQIDGYEGRSTHLMADNGDKVAYPSIYKSKSGKWKEQDEAGARSRGETFEFRSKEKMIGFAREGNWKNKRFLNGKFFK
jgi:hypothetical protein